MKKHIVMLLLMVIFVSTTALAEDTLLKPTQFVPTPTPPMISSLDYGTVKIISGGEEYNSFVSLINGRVLHNGRWMYMDGIRMFAGDREFFDTISKELPVVPYADDFEIITDGEPGDVDGYTLYNGRYEEIPYSQDFAYEKGEYILCIEVYKTGASTDEYLRYEHCFKIIND